MLVLCVRLLVDAEAPSDSLFPLMMIPWYTAELQLGTDTPTHSHRPSYTRNHWAASSATTQRPHRNIYTDVLRVTACVFAAWTWRVWQQLLGCLAVSSSSVFVRAALNAGQSVSLSVCLCVRVCVCSHHTLMDFHTDWTHSEVSLMLLLFLKLHSTCSTHTHTHTNTNTNTHTHTLNKWCSDVRLIVLRCVQGLRLQIEAQSSINPDCWYNYYTHTHTHTGLDSCTDCVNP